MLEPFDAAKATRDIVAHFEDLTKAHEAVRRAQAQLGVLTPLLADCDAHDKAGRRDRGARPPSATRCGTSSPITSCGSRGLLADLHAERARLTARREQLADRLDGLPASRARTCSVERAGHGGDRLAQIEQRAYRPGERAGRRAAGPRGEFRRAAHEGRPGPGHDCRAVRGAARDRSPPPAARPRSPVAATRRTS